MWLKCCSPVQFPVASSIHGSPRCSNWLSGPAGPGPHLSQRSKHIRPRGPPTGAPGLWAIFALPAIWKGRQGWARGCSESVYTTHHLSLWSRPDDPSPSPQWGGGAVRGGGHFPDAESTENKMVSAGDEGRKGQAGSLAGTGPGARLASGLRRKLVLVRAWGGSQHRRASSQHQARRACVALGPKTGMGGVQGTQRAGVGEGRLVAISDPPPPREQVC